MSDIALELPDSLKVLDPDGRLEKRTSRACLDMSALCADRVLMHCSKIVLYSITSSARASTDGGTSILTPIREDRSTLPIENQSFVNSGEGGLSLHFLFQDLTQYQE